MHYLVLDKRMQLTCSSIRITVSWLGLGVVAVLLALCLHLGQWQYHKAQTLLLMQARYQQTLAVSLPQHIKHIDEWQHKKVEVKGYYAPQYQFLLDNQVDDSRAGYYVLTPLLVDHKAVLVNRGWIPANATHSDVPQVSTPSGLQSITGRISFPRPRSFSLEPEGYVHTSPVRQTLNLAAYQRDVPFELAPFIILLDEHIQSGGGFVRHWKAPLNRIAVHLNYAYQWFGFALAILGIYIYQSVTRLSKT